MRREAQRGASFAFSIVQGNDAVCRVAMPVLVKDAQAGLPKASAERMTSLPPFGANHTLARHLKVMDWLKAELVGDVAALFKAVALGSQDALTDALSSILLTTYVLGRRLGVPFEQLEQHAALRARELAQSGHELERSYGDLSALDQHLGAHNA